MSRIIAAPKLSCFVCNFQNWCKYIPNYELNYQHVEELHFHISRLYTDDTNDLSILVDIIRVYSNLEEEIKKIISDHHGNNCGTCSHCYQHLTREIKSRIKYVPTTPEHVNYLPAITYLTGLSTDQYNGMKKLGDCNKEILDIYNMIGMMDIKTEFCKVLKYLTSHKNGDKMLHIGIYGPPGHGKTKIAQLLGKAFTKSGLLEKDIFVKAARSDLIGKYCGHTAKNTTAMFDKARGGVIFIDEIYALGNKEKRDVFTGECINTINQLLSERTDTLCIIAGYYKEAEECFFSYNPGLRSRFPFNFHIKPYTADDLCHIFRKMAAENGWTLADNALYATDLQKYIDNGQLNNAGRDMEHMLTKSIIAHCQFNFLLAENTQSLSRCDIQAGLHDYMSHKKIEDVEPPPPMGMYT